ncbi:MAG: ferritin-like domain-containing protein [Candidatus Heimdallarchaeota archaeon]|nr:ferritin-like domain-containing protein [Candidatus Heimdallarchaeota archaeon]
MPDKELLKFIEEQIVLEKKIVEISKKSVDDIKNVLVRELIRGITMDSKKHALLLTALKGMLEGPTPLIEEENFNVIKETIEKHIELEAKAIDTYKSLLKTYGDDKRIKMIISEIHKDEVRHHTFLQVLLKVIVEKETLTEDLLEDWLYKYAPFHGSPGG